MWKSLLFSMFKISGLSNLKVVGKNKTQYSGSIKDNRAVFILLIEQLNLFFNNKYFVP